MYVSESYLLPFAFRDDVPVKRESFYNNEILIDQLAFKLAIEYGSTSTSQTLVGKGCSY